MSRPLTLSPHTRMSGTINPRSIQIAGRLGTQDRHDVLSLTQQLDDVQMVAAFEVEPQQRKLGDLPGPKPRNTQRFPSAGEPIPGSSSIWSSAALVALTSLAATLVPPSLR